jgi:hypothetical protein
MGRITKKEEPERCMITDCDQEAVRSISKNKLEGAFTGAMIAVDKKRYKICKAHYREYKKSTKKDRKLETLGRDF